MTIRHINSKGDISAEASLPAQSLDEEEQEWPDAFYCVKFGKLLHDPVIGPTGDSYERSAVVPEADPKNKPKPSECYYPNRALKAIIEESVALRDSSWRASMRSIQQSLSQSLVQLMPESTSNERMFRPLNDAFYCPITFNLMHEPVTDPDGNSFEKVAIENWIRVNGNSPITRTSLRANQLYPNNAVRSLLEEEKQKPVDQMHPSVRKWKDEPTPQASDVELGGAIETPNANRQQSSVARPYPQTASQWERREQRLRRNFYSTMGMFFATACALLFAMYRSIFFFVLFSMSLLVIISNRRYQPN